MEDELKNEIKEMQVNNEITMDEDMKQFLDNLSKGNGIKFEDFNIYNKIKTDNTISPLIIYILEKTIEVFNQKLNMEEIKKYGFEKVGFGEYPG